MDKIFFEVMIAPGYDEGGSSLPFCGGKRTGSFGHAKYSFALGQTVQNRIERGSGSGQGHTHRNPGGFEMCTPTKRPQMIRNSAHAVCPTSW
jgi:hypothetical protein